MTHPSSNENSHAKWLRECADEIRAHPPRNHGWANTCAQAATEIERLVSNLNVVSESHKWLYQEKQRLETEIKRLRGEHETTCTHPASTHVTALKCDACGCLRPKTADLKPRGKPCTCDNCLGSSVPCRVEAGERLGELWYCRKAAESPLKTEGDPGG